MSDNPPIPLACADALITQLLAPWGLKEGGYTIAGSVRRRQDAIGDIDLLLPKPPDDEPDAFYEKARETTLEPAGSGLFAEAENQRHTIARPIKGFRPHFAYCQLEIAVAWSQLRGIPIQTTVRIDISRYRPDERGWMTLVKTGSAEFSTACLTWWKYINGTKGSATPGMQGFTLVTPQGKPVPTTSEGAAFRACRLLWVEPHLRTGEEAVLSPLMLQDKNPAVRAAGRKAMAHLGIKTEAELDELMRMDRLAGAFA